MRHLVVLFAALLEVVTSAIQFPEDALFSPNGEFVALYDRPTNIDVLAKNKKLWTANLRGRIDMAVLSADGSTVAVLTEGRRTGLCSVSLYMSNIVRTIDESAFETYFQRAAPAAADIRALKGDLETSDKGIRHLMTRLEGVRRVAVWSSFYDQWALVDTELAQLSKPTMQQIAELTRNSLYAAYGDMLRENRRSYSNLSFREPSPISAVGVEACGIFIANHFNSEDVVLWRLLTQADQEHITIFLGLDRNLSVKMENRLRGSTLLGIAPDSKKNIRSILDLIEALDGQAKVRLRVPKLPSPQDVFYIAVNSVLIESNVKTVPFLLKREIAPSDIQVPNANVESMDLSFENLPVGTYRLRVSLRFVGDNDVFLSDFSDVAAKRDEKPEPYLINKFKRVSYKEFTNWARQVPGR